MYWLGFVTLIIVMYLCISTIGKLTGGTGETLFDSVKQVFTPAVIFLMVFSNALFAAGIYFGFVVSSNALTISMAIGIITSYVYSTFAFGVVLSAGHVVGLLLILAGIYLLR